jgi:hypothetical protein
MFQIKLTVSVVYTCTLLTVNKAAWQQCLQWGLPFYNLILCQFVAGVHHNDQVEARAKCVFLLRLATWSARCIISKVNDTEVSPPTKDCNCVLREQKIFWQTGRVHDVKHGLPHQVHTPEYNTNVTDSVYDSPVFQLENHLFRSARIQNVRVKGPHKRLYMVEVQRSLEGPFLCILFYVGHFKSSAHCTCAASRIMQSFWFSQQLWARLQ